MRVMSLEESSGDWRWYLHLYIPQNASPIANGARGKATNSLWSQRVHGGEAWHAHRNGVPPCMAQKW